MESGVFYLYTEHRKNKQCYEFIVIDIDEYNKQGGSYRHWRWHPCCWNLEDGIVLLKRKKQIFIELALGTRVLYKQQALVGIQPFVKHTPEQIEIEKVLRKESRKGGEKARLGRYKGNNNIIDDNIIDECEPVQYKYDFTEEDKDIKPKKVAKPKKAKSKKGVKPKQIKPNKAVEEKEVVVKKKDWWDEKIF